MVIAIRDNNIAICNFVNLELLSQTGLKNALYPGTPSVVPPLTQTDRGFKRPYPSESELFRSLFSRAVKAANDEG
jgi:hypothetical protein